MSGPKRYWQCDRCGAICPEDKKMYAVYVHVEDPYMRTIFGTPMVREVVSKSTVCGACVGVIRDALAVKEGGNG